MKHGRLLSMSLSALTFLSCMADLSAGRKHMCSTCTRGQSSTPSTSLLHAAYAQALQAGLSPVDALKYAHRKVHALTPSRAQETPLPTTELTLSEHNETLAEHAEEKVA